MGGGHHWVNGNYKLLQECQKKIGNQAIVMSEDQGEAYIGDVDIFLTLFGFRRADAPFIQPMA
jgi:hypothetical protein